MTARPDLAPAARLTASGEAAGVVALNEVTMHGWDLAAATAHAYAPDAATVDVDFLAESRKGKVPESLFGPVVDVGDDASGFHRALGLAGRDPGWSAP